ncbi:hypothetical protein M0812_17683 [Anaeramoeba flamelloides]|uniref:Uncharacterized protein n=1 Tax=Anaeramoeba flamelloides TaxID=1746091 RepID=A0AAV7Z9H5_9EUKA|nr:hypothetical protein M0812_17683 [Anaeramoeba flamelloides]
MKIQYFIITILILKLITSFSNDETQPESLTQEESIFDQENVNGYLSENENNDNLMKIVRTFLIAFAISLIIIFMLINKSHNKRKKYRSTKQKQTPIRNVNISRNHNNHIHRTGNKIHSY